MTKYVYDFSEGDKDQKDLLGGKGANLAEMTKLGLPVPPGFTISTAACREYLVAGVEPAALRVEVTMALRRLEDALGKRLGDVDDPLLVSVRSGAKFSMPGMMETVLNVGLNDYSVNGLIKVSNNERFAWDSYRRLIQMFGKTVLDIEGEIFADALQAANEKAGVATEVDLTADQLKEVVETFKAIIQKHSGRDFPQDRRCVGSGDDKARRHSKRRGFGVFGRQVRLADPRHRRGRADRRSCPLRSRGFRPRPRRPRLGQAAGGGMARLHRRNARGRAARDASRASLGRVPRGLWCAAEGQA